MSSTDNFSWININQYNTLEEKDRHLELCCNILTHASSCHESNCPVDKCKSIRFLLEHTKECNESLSQSYPFYNPCELCKSVFFVKNYHSQKCDNTTCSIGNCAIRKKLPGKIQRCSKLLLHRMSKGRPIIFGKVIDRRIHRPHINKIRGEQLLEGLTAMSLDKESAGGSFHQDLDDSHEEIKIVTNFNGGAEVIKTYRVPNFRKLLLHRRQLKHQLHAIDYNFDNQNLPGSMVSYSHSIKIDNLQNRMIQSGDSMVSIVSDQEQLLDGMAAMNIDEPDAKQASTISE